MEFEVYFNFWLSKLCICAHLLVSSFQVLRCGAQSSLMHFLLFLFRTRSSCIDFNSRYFIIDMLELWNFHNLLLLWVVTKMLAQAITWSAEHIGGGKCIFQNIVPLNKMTFTGNGTILVSISAIKAMLEVLWTRNKERGSSRRQDVCSGVGGGWVKKSILFHEFYRNNKIKISDQRGHYKDQDERGY